MTLLRQGYEGQDPQSAVVGMPRRTAWQLRALIANDEARIAWYGFVLETYDTDCMPRNFHVHCLLARQMRRSHGEELAALLNPNTDSTCSSPGAGRPACAVAGPATLSP